MKQLKTLLALLMLLTLITNSRTFAQSYWFPPSLIPKTERLRLEVMQNNEYTNTGYEQGNFYNNPLMLNGKTLDYNVNLESKGELTVIKGAAITGKTTKVPFYVYLRRNGNKISIYRSERCDINQTKIDISQILLYAKPGDQLVIEAIKKEDGAIKRILKVLQGHGC